MSDHKAQDMKGRLEQAAGDVTDDKRLKREGMVDRASAATKTEVDKATGKMKDVVNPKR